MVGGIAGGIEQTRSFDGVWCLILLSGYIKGVHALAYDYQMNPYIQSHCKHY